MVPNVILDLPGLLVPFCAVCAGFAMVGIVALIALAIREQPRRTRMLPTVELGGARPPESPARRRARAIA